MKNFGLLYCLKYKSERPIQMKKTIVALTGTTGGMGSESLKYVIYDNSIDVVRVLARKPYPILTDYQKKYGDRFELVVGDMGDYEAVKKLVDGSSYVVNIAAVIPPKADHDIKGAETCNIKGVENIVNAIKELKEDRPKLIHISTLALYGDRNYKHPWVRVGDPLTPSAYDCYATTKTIGERTVLESGLPDWVVLRQTAMLHKKMLQNNMHDGLMFHTSFNGPLEWVTADDSGRLIRNIIQEDLDGKLTQDNFWRRVFNIGGGVGNRITGYEIINQGFAIIGGSAKSFMEPKWNALRNFHGGWFLDTYELDYLTHFITEKVQDYWKQVKKEHWYYSLGRLVPRQVIKKEVIEKLLTDENSPTQWYKEGLEGRIIANFGSVSKYLSLPETWGDFPLLSENKNPDDGSYFDYEALKNPNNAKSLDHGFDEKKKDQDIDIDDLKQAAEFRGGRLLTKEFRNGDMYNPVEWETHEGTKFFATPYTVLRAGHWEPLKEKEWDFDKKAKTNPFYAQIWYDSHSKDENYTYWYDENGVAKYKQD